MNDPHGVNRCVQGVRGPPVGAPVQARGPAGLIAGLDRLEEVLDPLHQHIGGNHLAIDIKHGHS